MTSRTGFGKMKSKNGKNARGEGVQQDGKKKAYLFALKLLGYRQRSEQELMRRLSMKGFGSEDIGHAIIKLKDYGYIDDKAMAGSLKLKAEERKRLGLRGARYYLKSMGISQENTDEALEGYDEVPGAHILAEKKMRTLGHCPARTARQKLSGYLKRRGFSSDTIKKAINEVLKENEK